MVTASAGSQNDLLEIKSTLYECAHFVAFKSGKVTPAHTSVWFTPSPPSKVVEPRSDWVVVGPPIDPVLQPQDIHTYRLWNTLVAGEFLKLRQSYCGSDLESNVLQVQPLPSQLLVPVIEDEHIYSSATHLTLGNVLPGAMVRIYVGDAEYGHAEAFSDKVIVHVDGPERAMPIGPGLRAEQSFEACGKPGPRGPSGGRIVEPNPIDRRS
jgi:hypothetical protein